MKFVLAQNNKMQTARVTEKQFCDGFVYGLRAGQGCPMRDPRTHEFVTTGTSPGFVAGHTWGQANPSSRDADAATQALQASWAAYQARG